MLARWLYLTGLWPRMNSGLVKAKLAQRCDEDGYPYFFLAVTNIPIACAAEENAKNTIEALFNRTMPNRRT
jgi:hypothetical protein